MTAPDYKEAFRCHPFRHTVGTQMINHGAPQHIIQKLLGHENPKITSRCAHISDQTLKAEFAKFQGKIVDLYGKVVSQMPENQTDLQWLKPSRTVTADFP